VTKTLDNMGNLESSTLGIVDHCTLRLRPIYTEELPGVAAYDSLFVLLRPGVAVPSRARAPNYPTQQNKQRIVRGYSWQLLSVDWPLNELKSHFRVIQCCK